MRRIDVAQALPLYPTCLRQDHICIESAFKVQAVYKDIKLHLVIALRVLCRQRLFPLIGRGAGEYCISGSQEECLNGIVMTPERAVSYVNAFHKGIWIICNSIIPCGRIFAAEEIHMEMLYLAFNLFPTYHPFYLF